MGLLIDQFLEALAEWSTRTGNPEDAWNGEILLWTGGVWRTEPVGAIDPATVPKERRASLSAADVHGRLTLEQVREDLQQFVDQVQMDEEFLIVVALIQRLDHDLEGFSEDYAKGVRKRRAEAERIEALLNDPERLEDALRAMNDRREVGQEPFTAAGFINLAQKLRKMAVPSLQEQRDNRVGLDTWRELTAPILGPRNLRRFRKAFAEQLGHGWIVRDDDDDDE